MNKNNFFIYKMYDNLDNLLYVGKTNNIKKRMNCHFSSSAVNIETWKNKVSFVEYFEMKNKYDMDIYEIYLIGKLKPINNKEFIYDSSPSFELNIDKGDSKFLRFDLKEDYEYYLNLNIDKRNHVKSLVNIYNGKMNCNYFKRNKFDSELSNEWFSKCKEKDFLIVKKNIVNFFNNIEKAKSENLICLLPIEFKENLSGKGYAKRVFSVNSYYNKLDLSNVESIAYIYNCFANNLLNFKNNITNVYKLEYKKDLHSIIDLLNIIFNSRVRNGEPINVYIPSRRMRELLICYLNNEI